MGLGEAEVPERGARIGQKAIERIVEHGRDQRSHRGHRSLRGNLRQVADRA
jgi:hypothetical protein